MRRALLSFIFGCLAMACGSDVDPDSPGGGGSGGSGATTGVSTGGAGGRSSGGAGGAESTAGAGGTGTGGEAGGGGGPSAPVTADVLWHSASLDQVNVWQMSGTTEIGPGPVVQGSTAGDWQVIDAGDFDGDGNADVLWFSPTLSELAVWLMSGTDASVFGAGLTATAGWVPIGAGDFDGDGKSDVLWHNATTDQINVWLMDGVNVLDHGAVLQGAIGLGWKPVGAADFDADGKADVLWHNATLSQAAVWLMDGGAIKDNGLGIPATPGWNAVAAADFDGDGKADILWHDPTNDQINVWLMDGLTVVDNGIVLQGSVGLGWVPVAASDFDGDGKADVLWFSESLAAIAVWLMNGTALETPGAAIQATPGFAAIAAGDFSP